jgi:hypothetical protein
VNNEAKDIVIYILCIVFLSNLAIFFEPIIEYLLSVCCIPVTTKTTVSAWSGLNILSVLSCQPRLFLSFWKNTAVITITIMLARNRFSLGFCCVSSSFYIFFYIIFFQSWYVKLSSSSSSIISCYILWYSENW